VFVTTSVDAGADTAVVEKAKDDGGAEVL